MSTDVSSSEYEFTPKTRKKKYRKFDPEEARRQWCFETCSPSMWGKTRVTKKNKNGKGKGKGGKGKSATKGRGRIVDVNNMSLDSLEDLVEIIEKTILPRKKKNRPKSGKGKGKRKYGKGKDLKDMPKEMLEELAETVTKKVVREEKRLGRRKKKRKIIESKAKKPKKKRKIIESKAKKPKKNEIIRRTDQLCKYKTKNEQYCINQRKMIFDSNGEQVSWCGVHNPERYSKRPMGCSRLTMKNCNKENDKFRCEWVKYPNKKGSRCTRVNR